MRSISALPSRPIWWNSTGPSVAMRSFEAAPTLEVDHFIKRVAAGGGEQASSYSGLLARLHSLLTTPTPVPVPQAPVAPAPAPPKQDSPAPAPPKPAPAPPKPAQTFTHTVTSGESLSLIAKKTLGDGNRWREIYELNRDQISNPNLIYPGQVLKLPGGTSEPTPKPVPAPPQSPAAHGGPITDRNRIYLHQPNNWTCGPTSLTMAAAAFGVRPRDNSTVSELTKRSRTNPNDGVPDSNALQDAARQIGLQARYQYSSTPADVRAALNKGHGVIYNGSLGTGGHFVYVAGLNPDGSFIVCDPWRSDVTRWTDAQLKAFGYTNGHHGGITEVWK